MLTTTKDIPVKFDSLIYTLTDEHATQVRSFLKQFTDVKRNLVLTKESILRNRQLSLELRKKRDQDIDKLELPEIRSALEYKMWRCALEIKNAGVITGAGNQKFMKLIYESIL